MQLVDLSIYLHIPFCLEKCDYCDFYSVSLHSLGCISPKERDHFTGRYVEALLVETERRLKEHNPIIYVPSIYIGGGTPSLLGANGIKCLLSGLKVFDGVREITVEANPESADTTFLCSCADHGVNRLSLGIQSFSEKVRKAAGRKGHSHADPEADHDKLLFRRLREAAEIFGPGLSLDLMSGLPGQDEETLYKDIETDEFTPLN
ncbi:MAG: radical SAM protein, partial [Treponema sp.]|nr:radical SAM protein [Treponema sp.]